MALFAPGPYGVPPKGGVWLRSGSLGWAGLARLLAGFRLLLGSGFMAGFGAGFRFDLGLALA